MNDEWAIEDHEIFGRVRIDQYAKFETVPPGYSSASMGALCPALLDHFFGDIDKSYEAIDDRHRGCHVSLANYVK
ncbi:hypothetical protein [Novosphingobium pokkalii]|uniref:Uncharacterized protein n=1 Tax=Novosphingobium pokkalii TaxID=1770194 RepID=A0ABV7UYP2_9SPHN|nr:hypothetical protein [Novosphingobium pokkalii]GHC96185.1 hypothetical protein GCM10019060_25950 [Novosphingobium pokkalii]